MFKRSILSLTPTRMNGFAIFARSAWRLPAITKAGSFRARSKLVHAAWKRLPAGARAKFNSIAARTPLPVRKSRLGTSAWHRFVKTNYRSTAIKKLPFKKRLPAIAKLWQKNAKN